jgi:hypothetical protein
MRIEWIDTIGQDISADHCPPPVADGVTAFDDDDAAPAPAVLLAVTTNV